MNRIRFAFALAALLLWAPARPQTAEPQRSSLPSRELAPAQLLAELRKGGYILYFRHAATDFSQNDEKMKRSEEHTSELQSPCNLVCRLLLEKKNRTRSHPH